MKTYYITTAIVYPNARPHIGFAYEQIITDALARWHSLKGETTFFLTGADENALKVEEAAIKANKSTQVFVDEIVALFVDLTKKLNLSNNRFIRTTEPAHKKVAQDIFKKVQKKGLIYKGHYEGLYCTGCEAFYTEKDLEDGKCPYHKKAPKKVKEESYFFKLSAFQKQLIELIQTTKFIQPDKRKKEILTRLKEPLRDLSISRKHKTWGIPVPGDKEHVIYVWFDALLNYLSGVDYPEKNYKKFWPPQCQVIGKEISWFHTVIWPAILMAADIKLPKTIFCHGWLTVEGQKMSKSLGNVIYPIELIKKHSPDSVWYYFLREIATGDDGDYSLKTFIDRNNADLANTLGNLLQRTSVMTHKYFKGKIPKPDKLTKPEKTLIKSIPNLKELDLLMNNFHINRCLEKIWMFIDNCNKYINETEPWKQKGKRLSTIIYTLIESLRIISILVSPFIPGSAEKLSKQLGQKLGNLDKARFTDKTKGTIKKPEILFKKIEENIVEDPFSIVNLKVAKVEDVKSHPNADSLYILKIKCPENRQLIAGLKKYLKPSELKNKNVIIVSNLKPAKLRGELSEGMLLAAEKNKKVKLLLAPKSKPGDQVYIEGIKPKTKTITFEKFKEIKFTTKNKRALYKNKPLKTKKEEVIVEIDDNAVIR